MLYLRLKEKQSNEIYSRCTVENGKSLKNVEVLMGRNGEAWQIYKLQDGRIMRVPVTSIDYVIDVKSEGEQNESK